MWPPLSSTVVPGRLPRRVGPREPERGQPGWLAPPPLLRGRPPWAWALVLIVVLCQFWPVAPWSAGADLAVWTTFFLAVVVMVLAGWLLLPTPAQQRNGGLMLLLAANASVVPHSLRP